MMSIWNALGMAGRIAVALCAAGLLFVLGWAVTEPARSHRRAAEARAAEALEAAQVRSADQAVEINDQAHAAAAAAEHLHEETSDVIHQAPGADARLDPALNAAARRRLCLRPAYRDSPECVQLARRAEPAR